MFTGPVIRGGGRGCSSAGEHVVLDDEVKGSNPFISTTFTQIRVGFVILPLFIFQSAVKYGVHFTGVSQKSAKRIYLGSYELARQCHNCVYANCPINSEEFRPVLTILAKKDLLSRFLYSSSVNGSASIKLL